MNILLEYEDAFDEAGTAQQKIKSELIRLDMLKNKYKTMWELRHLEDEIDKKECVIIIHQNGTITTKCHDTDLSDKIEGIVKAMKPD